MTDEAPERNMIEGFGNRRGKGRKIGVIPPDDKRCNYGMNGDNRCRNWRMKGGLLCGTHGKAAHIQDAAQRAHAEEVARGRAIKRIEAEGVPGVHGAEAVIELLEERLAWQVAMARGLDVIVKKLLESDELRYEHRAGEQLRGEVQAWMQVNAQVAKLGSDYLKIGLDERRTRIAEAQARILVGVIQAVLGRLELNGDQRKMAAVVVPEELQRVAIEGNRD